MPSPSFYRYRAFISYSHRDKAWCDWLHKSLERYRISADLAGRITAAGPVPRQLGPVFRDRADFSAGSLQAQTIEALKNSQFLIVIASPDSAASAYVNEEIRLFKSFAGEGRVLSLIVSGEAPPCFAPALRFRLTPEGAVTGEPADQVGADVAKDGKREALVKIVAALVGLPYDILWQRDVKAQRLRLGGYAAVGAIAIAAALGIYTSFGLRHDVAEIGEKSEEAAQVRHDEFKRGQEKLERLVIDAAGGGAPAVKAIAEIRDILRPGNPEIDAISAEQLPKVVQRIIADLQKPAAKPEDFTGVVKRALEQAQAQNGELKFVDAAKTLDEAIAKAEAERGKAEAESQNKARGVAALFAERGRTAKLQLRYREAAGFYAKAAEATAFDSNLSWGYALDAADALYAQGDEFGDSAALAEAVKSYRSALNLAPRALVPLDWATTQNNLGAALWRLGERESGTGKLEEAVSAYREALKERTRERVPLQWSEVQDNLGLALWRLGERESGTGKLEEAVSAYREALKERTRERVPLEWAKTQNDLGNALVSLGARESGTGKLEEAVSAYREALKERTRERVPLEWAKTQNNLGIVLTFLGESESGTEKFEDAVSAYHEALKEWRREHVPLYWAMAQFNLGNTLQEFGERESGTKKFQEAVSAYREALKERTRERVALEWAVTQDVLGNALEKLGERENGTGNLRKSVVAHREALKELTRERVPLEWAATQNNLGNALWALGRREGEGDKLEEAVSAYREALKERTRKRVPLKWAMTQYNLGNALLALGERKSGTGKLLEAVSAYSEALKEWTKEGSPYWHNVTQQISTEQTHCWHNGATSNICAKVKQTV